MNTYDFKLHLFYEEPDPDRWVVLDRYPRRMVRRLVRGPAKPGGVMRWFLNLRAGLDKIGANYCVNDYRSLSRTRNAIACVVGKPQVIEKIPNGVPIIFGPGISAHPFEDSFWERKDIGLLLASCEWFRQMYERDLPRPIPTTVWYAGIETDIWKPREGRGPRRVLVYDKIRWRRDEYEQDLLNPIIARLKELGCELEYLKYGQYDEEEYKVLLQRVGSMIFLCEHETQGFAYLQALSAGVPIFAWDRGGYWQDPSMFPHRVQFSAVTSVPFFDDRCGMKFRDLSEFEFGVEKFLANVGSGMYGSREFVCANFDLGERARVYKGLIQEYTKRIL